MGLIICRNVNELESYQPEIFNEKIHSITVSNMHGTEGTGFLSHQDGTKNPVPQSLKSGRPKVSPTFE